MAFEISRTSWLMHAEAYRTVDTEYWSLAIMPEIDAGDDDQLYELKLHDRIDSIADRFYGDPRFEWVIKRANGLYLWPIGVYPGMILRLPTVERLQKLGAIRLGVSR